MNMKKLGVELLLVAVCGVFALTVLISYVLTVYHKHADPYFPFISQLGNQPPERCVFTLGLNLGGIIGICIICVRYKHVRFLYADSAASIGCLNKFSIVVGFLSFCGLIIVASFQDKVVPSVHRIGAAMVFFFGIVYQWVQTVITYRTHHFRLSGRAGKATIAVRLMLSLVDVVILLFGVVGLLIRYYDSCHLVECHTLYLMSTVSEWVLAICFLLFFLTFHWEFMDVSLSVKVKTRSNQTTIMGSFNDDSSLTL